MAVVNVTVTGHEAAIKAFNTKIGMISWDWLDAIPDSNARCRKQNADSTTTITYKSATEKLAHAKDVAAWDAEVTVEGEFAAWLDKMLGIGKKDANARLVKAVYGGASGKLTTFYIGVLAWALKDSNGVVEAHDFSTPIAKGDFSTEFTAGVGEMLAAVKAVRRLPVKALLPCRWWTSSCGFVVRRMATPLKCSYRPTRRMDDMRLTRRLKL
ncbi:MAG: hypothetical protein K2X44_03515 [Magnetospirillum sp.]|nr:hypothetical protein [Magnetospirillum sp.]